MTTESGWRERETALLWGAPMVLLPALALVPVTVSLVIDPAFAHARMAACVLTPLLGACAVSGLSRLALCFRREFDVITLFAGGTVVILLVICMSAGVVLASVVANL